MNLVVILIGSLLAMPTEALEITIKAHSGIAKVPEEFNLDPMEQKDKIIQLGISSKHRTAQLPTEMVCHSLGCAEVQAALEGLQTDLKAKKLALAQCSKARQQLQKDLGEAAKQRAVAEAALAKCATERGQLEAELYQCASVDRPAAEKALAECARDRAKLEAELAQCANVDRPNAEKALAKCAAERAALEKELAVLVQKMKEKAADGSSSTGAKHRRRRRSARRRSSKSLSLSQVTSQLEAESMASLKMRKTNVEKSLSELAVQSKTLEQELAAKDQELAKINNDLGEIDAKETASMKRMEKVRAKEEAANGGLTKAEVKTVKILKELDEADKKLELSGDQVSQSDIALAKASVDLQHVQTSQGALLVKLVDLIQKEQHMLQSKLQEEHKNATALLNTHEATLNTLASLGADKDGCNAARVEIIKTKQQLQVTSAALEACLQAKKEIQAKIDAAMKLGDKAQEALTKCLQTKAKLKEKIKMCHDKRDEARAKLKDCLARKVVLKKQIEACHTKRNEARAKLTECLSRKSILNARIKFLKGSHLRLAQSEVHTSLAELEKEMPQTLEEAQSALAELGASDKLLQEAIAALAGASDEEKAKIEELVKSGKLTDEAAQEVQSTEEEEGEATALTDEMVDSLKLVLSELRTAGSDVQAAAVANQDSSKSLLLLQESLARLMP